MIKATDVTADQHFGADVAVAGNTIVVGAPGECCNGPSTGYAYVFYRDLGGAENWGQALRLNDAAGESGDMFGTHVAVSGGTAAVVAEYANTNEAEAFVYDLPQ